jgi:hypothetical protein
MALVIAGASDALTHGGDISQSQLINQPSV